MVRVLLPGAHTAVVALTHDPKLDDLALLEALQPGAAFFYVGALGSVRSQAARRQRLAEHFDLTQAQLARLHGPVGLAIGARTPVEIAVSVAAQLVQVRSAPQGTPAEASRTDARADTGEGPTCAVHSTALEALSQQARSEATMSVSALPLCLPATQAQ